jgi:ribonuclease HI
MTENINDKKRRGQPGLFDSAPMRRKYSGHAVMHCDGASSGNPGESGVGVVIDIPDEYARILDISDKYRIAEYAGTVTNNVAEYTALIKGLDKAKSLGIKRIKIYLDSELLVRQMNGIYKVKNKNLIPLWSRAKRIAEYFESCTITHVRRELNAEADALARQGVKKRGGI